MPVELGQEEKPKQIAAIVISAEGSPERTVELGEHLTIGRAPSNQLVIDDAKVSRSHAEIRQTGSGRFQLRDLGSANGTWLNGRRVTSPRELENGDTIRIEMVQLRFVAPDKTDQEDAPSMTGTAVLLKTVQVVVLVADIRSYTGMSESLRGEEFSSFIADWFRVCGDIIKKRGGTVDKFIGDAVLAYWIVPERSPQPGAEVNRALDTARDLVTRAGIFSARLSARFPSHLFAIGIGLNAGEAVFGNMGSGEVQSFTVAGDSVNIAFRLESLTKEKACPIVASSTVVDNAEKRFQFQDLGFATVKGRKEPVHVFGFAPNANFES